MANCSHCGFEIIESSQALSQPTECPQCGQPFIAASTLQDEPRIESGLDFIQEYLLNIRKILTMPGEFFRRLPLTGGIGGPLTFALVTHWFGSAIGFLWSQAAGAKVSENFLKYLMNSQLFNKSDPLYSSAYLPAQNLFYHWYLGMGSVLLDPFFTLISVFTTSSLIFISARILVSPTTFRNLNEVTFESSLRVVSYSLAPSLLMSIPFFGKVISSLYVFILTLIAIKEVYKVSPIRAICIALFPKLFIFVIIGIGLFFLFFSALKFLALFFS